MKQRISLLLVLIAAIGAAQAQSISIGLSGGGALYADATGLTASAEGMWNFPLVADIVRPELGLRARYSRIELRGHTDDEIAGLLTGRLSWKPVGQFSVFASVGLGGSFISDKTAKTGVTMAAFTVEPGLGAGFDLGAFRIVVTGTPSIDITASAMKTCALVEAGVVYTIPFGAKK